ncbi:acyloxyacyl hydrolase [uncultured Bacteroides sp.]|uniref:acyloxyacyl hydrolase n=1 Tax=uncultured Bacteroides sp. TaxID=162156 RepID=UPI0026198B9F|nr:acyloxyacyl hydrolase [uncultured Bacteroides sp.]
MPAPTLRYTLLARLLATLLSLFAAGAKPQAQPSGDTLSNRPRHGIGCDFSPAYTIHNDDFFCGHNMEGHHVNSALTWHFKYYYRFAPASRLGRLYPNTYQGVGVGFTKFDTGKELGAPVSVYVFQGAPIARLSRRLTLNYEWNFGASFHWKKHDFETNPMNDVVGSRINAYINTYFYMEVLPLPNWRLSFGVDLTHFSNGNTNFPNVGVNTVGVRFGASHTFGDEPAVPSASSLQPAKPLSLLRRIGCDVVLYGATRRRGIIIDDEPALLPGSYGIGGINVNPMYFVNKYFRAGFSLDAKYDESVNLRKYHVEGTEGEDLQFYRPPFREQVIAGFSLRAELTMPIFSVNFGVGSNFIRKGEETHGLYQILVLKTFLTPRLFLHIGYQLRDFSDPNNLMLGMGFRFGKS